MRSGIYVVVQFCPWFKFSFLLFWGMVIYDNEFETKKNNIEPRMKLNHNTYTTAVKCLNRYFCFLLLGFHLLVSEKWAKMYKSVSQHNYLSIFLKILSFFSLKTLRAKRKSCWKMVPIITSASVFSHLELF